MGLGVQIEERSFDPPFIPDVDETDDRPVALFHTSDPTSTPILLTRTEWSAFKRAVRAGHYDDE